MQQEEEEKEEVKHFASNLAAKLPAA